MKTIIILLTCIACLVGCGGKKSATERLAEYDIVVIDSCEYISYKTSYDYLNITHKGNCKYCRERLSHKYESAAYSLAVDSLGNIIDTSIGKIKLNRY